MLPLMLSCYMVQQEHSTHSISKCINPACCEMLCPDVTTTEWTLQGWKQDIQQHTRKPKGSSSKALLANSNAMRHSALSIAILLLIVLFCPSYRYCESDCWIQLPHMQDNRDKRVELLQQYAFKFFPSTKYLNYALQVETYTLQKAANLVMNVDGCIGTLFLDLLHSSSLFTEVSCCNWTVALLPAVCSWKFRLMLPSVLFTKAVSCLTAVHSAATPFYQKLLAWPVINDLLITITASFSDRLN